MGLLRTALTAFLLLVPLGLVASERPKAIPRLESNRGGFLAFSDNADLRRRLIREAESCWQSWQALFPADSPPDPQILIVDQAEHPHSRNAGLCMAQVAEADAGLWKIQVDVFSSDAFWDGSFQREVFRALAFRRMYAGTPPRAGQLVAQPPGWFLEALTEEVRRKSGGLPHGLVERLLPDGRPPDLEAFLAVQPERRGTGPAALYRAQALALLEVLRANRSGLERLVQRGSKPLDVQTLSEFFSDLGGVSGLSRRWTLALVKTSSPSNLASMGLIETNTRLTEILGGEGEALAGVLAEKARSRGGAYLLRLAEAAILQLELPAHPLMRPILADYRAILDILARKPKSNVRERILDNETRRIEFAILGRSASELLDWAEVEWLAPGTRIVLPPDFEPAPRDDPYARALDRIEAVGP